MKPTQQAIDRIQAWLDRVAGIVFGDWMPMPQRVPVRKEQEVVHEHRSR